jgi:DHA3 family multidrug efflux protein-like MFS transporter
MSTAHKTFYHLLANTLVASVTNNFVWFALTFWVFLETKSVLATSYVAGSFAVAQMVSALFFGGIVDHHRKQTAMIISNLISLLCFAVGTLLYLSEPPGTFSTVSSVPLWLLIVILIIGTVAGNLRMIALTTCVSMLFTTGRDKMNGLVGTVTGMSFVITSILSGLAIGFSDFGVALIAATSFSLLTLFHLLCISIPETVNTTADGTPKKFDLRGTWILILGVGGLLPLILYTTLNNFLGGVFMSLVDAYGLSLMSVQSWGLMLTLMSLGFIVGGAIIARFGLGSRPLRRLLIINLINWTTCIFFVIQPSIILLGIGMVIWMTLFPFIEATEQTVIQKVIPYERQGRVFGFAQSIESAASPVTAFLIGPLAQFFFIPFMTTGLGAATIGGWFGTGADRGIALVFITAGIIGTLLTLFAFQSSAYRHLSQRLAQSEGS